MYQNEHHAEAFAQDRSSVSTHPAPLGGRPTGRVSCTLVDPKQVDDNLRGMWTALANEASEANVFYEEWCLLEALERFDRAGNAQLLTVWDQGADPETMSGATLIGLMPVARQRHFGRWPIAHMQNWLHDNCFLGTPLVARGHERPFWRSVLAHCDTAAGQGYFLHMNRMGLDGPIWQALQRVCIDDNHGLPIRRCDLVQSESRAVLPREAVDEGYAETTVRKKKRKEYNRQRRRLEEEGELDIVHGTPEGADAWIDAFIALEQRGWKGRNGSATASSSALDSYTRAIVKAAEARGKLHCISMTLNGTPIAMLLSLSSRRTGFSYKTAFDEDLARFSPGVLLQVANFDMLERHGLMWCDSCAAEDHPMIDSLWSGRRRIGRISIGLSGMRRHVLSALRFGETIRARQKAQVDATAKDEGEPA